jgi:2-amino-4-hydroxy-6-hydroxymethyldihydropteridine diphosphokinase
MRCGIGLGSNVGDRLENLRRARQQLLDAPDWLEDTTLDGGVLCAPVYETDPVGCAPGTAAFLNTVLELPTRPETTPALILRRLQTIENALGRPARHPRNAPRSIDLDLLYLGTVEMHGDDTLTIPHPRLHARRFVLAPLADIRPALILPGDPRPMEKILEDLPATSRVVLFLAIW